MQVIAAAAAASRGRGTFVRRERPCKNKKSFVSDLHELKLRDKTGEACTIFLSRVGSKPATTRVYARWRELLQVY
jgi:hypothetical protein